MCQVLCALARWFVENSEVSFIYPQMMYRWTDDETYPRMRRPLVPFCLAQPSLGYIYCPRLIINKLLFQSQKYMITLCTDGGQRLGKIPSLLSRKVWVGGIFSAQFFVLHFCPAKRCTFLPQKQERDSLLIH